MKLPSSEQLAARYLKMQEVLMPLGFVRADVNVRQWSWSHPQIPNKVFDFSAIRLEASVIISLIYSYGVKVGSDTAKQEIRSALGFP